MWPVLASGQEVQNTVKEVYENAVVRRQSVLDRHEAKDVIKEGYLIKTKLVRGMHKSHKLRYFVLFQHPDSKQPQLEYFEGKTLKGSASLANARAIPLPNLRSAQMSVRACIRCFCLHTIRMVTYSHDIHAT